MNPVPDDALDFLTGLGLVVVEERGDGSARSVGPGRVGVSDDLATAIARAAQIDAAHPHVATLIQQARTSGHATGELAGARIALQRRADRLLRAVIVPLDRTAASVVHELANALTGIAGWAQIAGSSGPLPERVRSAIEVLDRSSADALDTAKTLLTSLHGIQRAGSGEAAADVGSGCDVADVVGAAIATLRPLADRKDVVIRAKLAEGLRAAARPAELRSIATNLVKNAIEALDSGGEIVVAAERGAEDDLVLTVVDDGPGLDGRTIASIFDPWVSGKSGGTGLGLALVRDLARARGGEVRAESGRGRGARFVVRLPRLRASKGDGKGEGKVQRSSGVRRRSTGSMRAVSGGKSRPLEILLVDDDDTVRSMLSTALELRGARVTAVEGVRAAGALLDQKVRFDVALVDLTLRDGRGDQLARWLNENRLAGRIVLTTGAAVTPAEAVGAAAVLRKPFAIEDLLELVDRLGREAKARAR